MEISAAPQSEPTYLERFYPDESFTISGEIRRDYAVYIG